MTRLTDGLTKAKYFTALALASWMMTGFGFTAPAQAQVLPSEEEENESSDESNWLTFGSEEGPKLTINQPEIDLGTINDVEVIKSYIEFENTGTGLLTIEDVKTSCGCTAAKLQIKDYLPGEGGRVDITYDPKGRSGMQRKDVTIVSNDRDQRLTKVKLKVMIDPIVEVEDRALSLREIIYGDGASVEAIYKSDWAVFEPKEVRAIGDHYTAEIARVEEVEKPDGTTEKHVIVTVKINDDAPIGYVRRNIELVSLVAKNEGDEPFEYTQTARLNATVVGDLRAAPVRINLGQITSGDDFEREITIFSRGGKEFEILGVEIGRNPGVPLEFDHVWETDPTGRKACRITVKGKAPVTAGILNGSVVVLTDQDAQSKIEVNLMGSVARPRR